MVKVDNVSLAYGEKRILDNFSLDLPSRGVIGLLGPSGCGKTTLLHIIAGLIKPDKGMIHIKENAKISMVFQEDRLLPSLNVMQNVMVALTKCGQSHETARKYLKKCGLADCELKRIGELSGGMKRRVAIARAIAFDGDILLLDEPFKGLDGETKEKIGKLVFHKKERLTLFITHEQDEAYKYATQLIKFSGPPLAVV